MIYHQFFCDPEKEHTTVVLLHAFPLNSRMWEPQFQQLREQRIPYLAFDYPGFGQSMAWNKSPTMSDYAEVAYFAIKKLNLPKVVVVGLSMGGYVALSLYQKYPDIFHGLVLANTRAVADSEEGKKKRFKLVEEIRNDPSMNGLIQMHLEKFFWDDSRTTKPELPILAESLMKDTTPQGVIHALQAMAGRPDSTGLLSKMDFPVLVIAGEKDSLTSVGDAQAMTDKLPKGELSVILSAAHLSNLEKPGEFNRILIRYLSDLGLK